MRLSTATLNFQHQSAADSFEIRERCTSSMLRPCSFETLGASLWWTIVSMTTVGYGDYTPKSDSGRILAILIMLSGISLISI